MSRVTNFLNRILGETEYILYVDSRGHFPISNKFNIDQYEGHNN